MSASTSESTQNDSIASSGDSNSSGPISPAHLTAALSAVAPNRKAVVVQTVLPANLGSNLKWDEHQYVNLMNWFKLAKGISNILPLPTPHLRPLEAPSIPLAYPNVF